MGVPDQHIYIDDLREEFVRDFVFPMMRANARYEGDYLLGTSIARPLISKRLVEIARETGADAVAHGATGKGNDQVRFELSAYALNPDIKVIAPWREWDLTSRTALIAWAEQHQIPVPKDKRGESPFSTDANLLHTSSARARCSKIRGKKPRTMSIRARSTPRTRPTRPNTSPSISRRGDGVALNGEAMSPATLLTALNELGRKHGIGRLDLVENRFVGMKSRGMYETPGGEIYARAHRGIESDHAGSRRGAPQGRADAEATPSSSTTASGSRPSARCCKPRSTIQPGEGFRHGPAQALQGQRQRGRPQVAQLAVLGTARHVRRRRRCLRPEGRGRLHQAERAAPPTPFPA